MGDHTAWSRTCLFGQRINILSFLEAAAPASSFRSAAKLPRVSETSNVQKPSWADRSVANLRSSSGDPERCLRSLDFAVENEPGPTKSAAGWGTKANQHSEQLGRKPGLNNPGFCGKGTSYGQEELCLAGPGFVGRTERSKA